MINKIDAVILYFFNTTCHSALCDRVMPLVTQLGDGFFLFIAALILLVPRDKRARAAGILLMAGMTFSYHIVSVIKDLTARPRPFHALDNVNTLFTSSGYSFPSNHAAMAFMAAAVLSAYFGKRVLFFSLALIAALSRVYLGAHYFTDVLAGALLGFLTGYILTRIMDSSGTNSRA
ncbi:MAG: phosphatase PAP2 family protein [Candidatus Omnitrophota bacterium]